MTPSHSPKQPHIITLVLIAGLAAGNMNLMLPSLPGIEKALETSYSNAQLLVSGYLGGTAILQLFLGPLSDRYGRRPVMLWCLVIFLIGTLICMLAPNIETLIVGRMIQTTVATGIALSRAIVRDLVSTEEAASMIGYITMGMTIVPMIVPTFGGILEENYGWRAGFYLLFLMGVLVLAIAWWDLEETNQTRSTSLLSQFRSYPKLLTSRRFWGYSLIAGFASGAFFAVLGGAPFVALNILGMTPTQLGMSFIFIAFGYMVGNFLSGKFSRRMGIIPMMAVGSFIACSGLLLSLALFSFGLVHPLSFFAPIFFVGMGNGLTLPSANAGIVSVRPHLAGSASGLGGALMIGGGATLAYVTGTLLTVESGPYPLIYIMLAASTLAIVATAYVAYIERQMKLEP